MPENLLQNAGILLLVFCVGAVILIALVALVARNAFKSRADRQPTYQRDQDEIANRRPIPRRDVDTRDDNLSGRRPIPRSETRQEGKERPTYDDDDVRSSGGFGN